MVNLSLVLMGGFAALTLAQNEPDTSLDLPDISYEDLAPVHQNSKRVVNNNNEAGIYWCEKAHYKGKCHYTHKPLGSCIYFNHDPFSIAPDRWTWNDKPMFCTFWNGENCKGSKADISYPGRADVYKWYGPKIGATGNFGWPTPISAKCFLKK